MSDHKWLQIILLSVVTAVLAAALAIGVVITLWDRSYSDALAARRDSVPDDWAAQLRQLAVMPPALTALRPEERTQGNAAAQLLLPPDSIDNRLEAYSAILEKLVTDTPLDGVDSSVVVALLSDTSLASFDTARSAEEYDGWSLMREWWEGESLFDMPFPNYSKVLATGNGLLARARLRVDSAPQAALQDVLAVMGVGARLYRDAGFLGGHVSGRNLIRLGAGELNYLAGLASDSAIQEVVDQITEWVEGLPQPGGVYSGVYSNPDSAAGIARRSTLPTAWRTEAIVVIVMAEYRPKNILGGADSQSHEVLAGLQGSGNRQVAAAATLGVVTLSRFDALGLLGRWRLLREFGMV